MNGSRLVDQTISGDIMQNDQIMLEMLMRNWNEHAL